MTSEYVERHYLQHDILYRLKTRAARLADWLRLAFRPAVFSNSTETRNGTARPQLPSSSPPKDKARVGDVQYRNWPKGAAREYLQGGAAIRDTHPAYWCCAVCGTKRDWTEGRTYRQNFPEGCGGIELNARVQALDADDELRQLVQLAEREHKQRTTAGGGADDMSTNQMMRI